MAITLSGDGITSANIAADGIDGSKIADDAVSTDHLANSINTEIAANTAKTGITSGQASAITAALPKAGGSMTGILNITTSGTGMTFNTPSTGQNSWITWKDGGTAKWEVNKNTANNFNIYSYAYGSNVITFKETGKVGIGTTSPDGKLHVHTASAGSVTAHTDSDDLVVENSSHAGIAILSPDANRSSLFFGHTSDNLQLQIRHDGGTSLSQIISDDPIGIFTGGTERMHITGAGNVGIGTASPGILLHVNKGGNGDIAYFKGTDAGLYIQSASGVSSLVSHDGSSYDAVRLRSGGADANSLTVETSGDVTIGTGNLVIGTSGKGIDFSVTSNTSAPLASMSNELLDDYEEGSWSPYITTNGGVYTTTSRGMSGFYTKIGRQVTCHWSASITTPTGGSGAVRLNNFPFAAANANHTPTTSMQWGRTTLAGSPMYGMMGGNSSQMWFEYSNSNGNPTQMPAGAMNQTTPYHNGQVTYYVD